MSEAAAVLLDRSLRLAEHETTLEVGWLLAEMEQRFGYSVEELARRFDRSVTWVSRRLGLVELLPETIQQQVREGKIAAQAAMKFLVPVARQSLEDCQRMAAIFAEHHCDTREAGLRHCASCKVENSVMDYAHGQEEYVRQVLESYWKTLGTMGTVRRADRLLAAQLYQRGLSLKAIENALVLVATRRLIRPADARPLGAIRSLAYFLPVIDEVLELRVSPDYFEYLRHKLTRTGLTR